MVGAVEGVEVLLTIPSKALIKRFRPRLIPAMIKSCSVNKLLFVELALAEVDKAEGFEAAKLPPEEDELPKGLDAVPELPPEEDRVGRRAKKDSSRVTL